MKWLKGIVAALMVAVMFWMCASFVDVVTHNAMPDDGDPCEWNFFAMLTEVDAE